MQAMYFWFCFVLVLFCSSVFAEEKRSSQPPLTSDKSIEVKGQARGASVLHLGRDKFQIKFIQIRKDYSDEILNTPY